MTEWYNRFGIAWAALGDSVSSFWDVVTGPFPTDEQTYKEVLRTSLRVPVGIGHAAFQTVAAPVQGIGEGLSAAWDAATYPARAYQTALNLTESPQWMQQQGYRQDANNLLPVQLQAIFDSDTWDKAWQEAENFSLGQSAWIGYKPAENLGFKVDVLNRQKVQELKDETLFSVVTGLTDAAASWYLDPAAKAGRVIEGVKNVRGQYGMGAHATDPWLERQLFKRTPLGVKETDPDVFAQSDRVNEFLLWAVGKSPREIIAHPMIDKMSKKDDAAGIIAGLLDGQDFETAKLVIAHGFGSLTARQKLEEVAKPLATRIDNLNNVTNRPLSLEIANKGQTGNWLPPDPKPIYAPPRGTPPMSMESIQTAAFLTRKQNADIPSWTADEKIQKVINGLQDAEKAKDEKTLALITQAIGERVEAGGIWGDMIYRVPRKGDNRKADKAIAYRSGSFSKWEETFIPGKAFGWGTRVVTWPGFKLAHGFTDKRPPTWFDPNRTDASPALQAYMRHAKVFDDNQINGRMNEYLSAMDLGQRAEVLRKTETEAIVKMGQKYGLSKKDALLIAKESVGRRNRLITKLKSGKADDQVYGVYDEDGNAIRWALFETQEVNSVPLLDLQAYDRVFKKHQDTLRTMAQGGDPFSGRQFLDDAFEVFNGLWSGINLLRVGYTIRNLTDDTLRALASLGSLALMGNINDGRKAGVLSNAAIRTKNVGKRTVYSGQRAAVQLYEKLFDVDPATATKVIQESFDQMGRDLGSVTTQSALGFTYRGSDHRAPYDYRAEAIQHVVGSSFHNISGTSADLTKNLRRHQAEWEVLAPDAPTHLDSWIHAIHFQIGQSELGRKFLEGMNGEEVLNWLTRTREGRNVLSRLGRKDKNDPTEKAWARKSREEVEELVGRAQAVVDNYVPILDDLDDPLMLRKLALEGKVTKETLEELFPKISHRPHVHGPTVDFNLSQGKVIGTLEAITNAGFKFFGQMPTDKLVRHPVFRRLYIGNIRRLHNVSELKLQDEATKKLLQDMGRLDKDGQWTSEHLRQMEHIARSRSLKQINDLLYDGTTKSNIAHRLRFVSAFFSAWEDSMTKWARIAVAKPQTVVQGAKLWNAPNQANIGYTEDEAGNPVPRFTVKMWSEEEKQYIKAPVNWNPFDWNQEAYLEVRLPENLAKKIPGHEGGPIQISKPSMNLVMQGNPWWLPGAGPLTQIAIGEFSKKYPTTLKDVYKWAIPFGAEDNLVYSLLPAWQRRLWDSGESVTDQSKAFVMARIMQTRVMQAKLDNSITLPPDDVFYREIERETEEYFKLRSFTSFFAPFAVQFKSPYQFYIDKLQALRAQEKPGDLNSADEKFLAEYGDDFFMFTMSMTKNNLGLPASPEAWDKSQKVKDLIAKDPDLAAIYVGQINDPTFDQYVYDAQRRMEIEPGTNRTAREARTPKQILEEAEIAQGRRVFGRYMDAIDALIPEKDVPLEFINFYRQHIAKKIATQYPKWAEDYYMTEPNKVPDNIDKLIGYIRDNPDQIARSEIQTLAKYLTVREQFQSVLDEQEKQDLPHTLGAEANRDLLIAWKSAQEMMVESNTLFGRIFWRYLSNDRLQKRVGPEPKEEVKG